MMLRRAARRTAHLLLVGLVLAACSEASAGPVPVAGLPDLAEYVEADEPPLELPAEALEFKEADRESDRLLARTRRTLNLCAAMDQLEVMDEPAADDLDALLGYASQYLTTLQSIDPTGKVRDPEDEDDEIEVPEEVMENLATQEQAMFAYLVRLSYFRELHDQQQLSAEELQQRLDDAFVQLFHSDYTAADRELVAALPQYC